MKNQLLQIVGILSLSLSATYSFACTVMPFDADAKAKEVELAIANSAIAAFGDDLTNVRANPNSRKLTWLSITGDYIWTSPMCPEGWEIKGELAIDYDPNGTFPSTCRAIFEVERSKTRPDRHLVGAKLENNLSLKLITDRCKNLDIVLH